MNNTSNKSLVVYALLGFFLGLLGVHRMYVGKIASGVFYLLMTMTGFGMAVTLIGCLIDGLSLVFGTPTDSQGRPLGSNDTTTTTVINTAQTGVAVGSIVMDDEGDAYKVFWLGKVNGAYRFGAKARGTVVWGCALTGDIDTYEEDAE